MSLGHRSRLATAKLFRSQRSQVAAVLLVAAALRLALFNHVGIFGDFGYWAYDSRLIMEGQQPFIDFPGRSPLMVYLLAVVRDAVGGIFGPLRTLRGTVIVLWLLTALPVYALARAIYSHRAGLVAMVAFTSAPYALVYGMWLNSQSLGALCSVTGVLVVYRYWRQGLAYVLAGSLIGLGFLARRATIVALAGIGFWTMWRLRSHQTGRHYWRGLVGRGALTAAAFVTTLYVGYLGTVGWQPATAWQLFELDFVGLLTSGGRGAYPMLGVETVAVEASTRAENVPVLEQLCPACGAWTARRGLKIMILGCPVLGVFAVWVRDWVDRYYDQSEQEYLFAIILVLVIYAVYRALSAGFPYRAIALAAFVLFGVAAWQGPRLDADILYRPGMRLLLVVMGLMVLSYLMRERRIIVYYMMDNWPYICAAAGVLGVAFWERAEWRWRQVFVVAIALGVIVAAMIAAPLGNLAETGYLSMSGLAAIGADMDNRVGSDERVFAPNPVYVAGSEARLWDDNPRVPVAVYVYNDTHIGQQSQADLESALAGGEIEYLVYDGFAEDMFTELGMNQTVERNYCEVGAEPFAHLNASLYRYGGQSCTTV